MKKTISQCMQYMAMLSSLIKLLIGAFLWLFVDANGAKWVKNHKQFRKGYNFGVAFPPICTTLLA